MRRLSRSGGGAAAWRRSWPPPGQRPAAASRWRRPPATGRFSSEACVLIAAVGPEAACCSGQLNMKRAAAEAASRRHNSLNRRASPGWGWGWGWGCGPTPDRCPAHQVGRRVPGDLCQRDRLGIHQQLPAAACQGGQVHREAVVQAALRRPRAAQTACESGRAARLAAAELHCAALCCSRDVRPENRCRMQKLCCARCAVSLRCAGSQPSSPSLTSSMCMWPNSSITV